MRNLTIYLLLPLIGLFLCNRLQETVAYRHRIVRAMQSIEGVYTMLLNAETGQRGYLLTERESYLEPYVFAEQTVSEILTEAKNGALGEVELDKVKAIEKHALAKMAELRQSIDVCRANGAKAAIALVNDNGGKKEMDQIRILIEDIQNDQFAIWTRTSDELADLLSWSKISMMVVVALSSAELVGRLIVWKKKAAVTQSE